MQFSVLSKQPLAHLLGLSSAELTTSVFHNVKAKWDMPS